jgi:rhodanese-related sulfurtransferase
MATLNAIAPDRLARLIGRADTPVLIDVRTPEDFSGDPRTVPGAVRRSHDTVADWADEFRGRSAVVICQKGEKLAQGVAGWLRHAGVEAETLDGGALGWAAASLPMVPADRLPRRDAQGRTLWVTRARPKVDRIACPWLIRRFVDRDAVFLFVNPQDVPGVAERFGATPFDVEGEGVFWSHRGERCTFDVMVEEFGLGEVEPLARLAAIVRGADTARPDLAPEAPGLLAISLGLSRMYSDDLAQLEAGLTIYDALYRWCRDATDETHNWPNRPAKPSAAARAREGRSA